MKKKKFNKEKFYNILKVIFEYFMVALGCFIMALSFNIFCKPHQIAPGGFSGIAAVIYYLTGFPVGLATFILSLPWFVVLLRSGGLKALIKTLFGTAMFSLALDLTSCIDFSVNDIFLTSIFGGITMGFAVGIVFAFKGTTGGTDLIASVLHNKFSSVSSGVWLLIIDIFVVGVAGFALGEVEISLYSAITVYVSMKVIELMENGFNVTKAFYIISDKSEMIKEAIFAELDRGATYITARGGYSNEEKDILLCIVNRLQISEMKSIIRSIDENAFVFMVDVNEVFGEGFKTQN